MWAAIGGDIDFANSSLFGLKETFTMPTGWCTMIMFFTLVSSGLCFFTQFTLPPHMSEPDPGGFDESSRLVEEVEKMYDAEAKA